MHCAAIDGRTNVAELLVSRKADVNAKANDGWTPLHLAAQGGYPQEPVARLLLANNADVNGRANDGQTPLHVAAAHGTDTRMVKLLLDNMGDINARDNAGNTPLHLAARGGHKDIVELLIANKAEVNAGNIHGDTPLRMAVLNGHNTAAEFLRQHGGNEAVRLPPPQAATQTQGQQGSAVKTGNIAYSRVVIRNGALVLKDVHDSYEGDGWIAGTVVSLTAKALVVSASGTVLAGSAAAKNKEYTLAVDEKTSVCIAQKPVASSLMAISGLQLGQRVSVAFRKGTQTADRIVDQSYEIVTRMATPLSASPTRPSMPECD